MDDKDRRIAELEARMAAAGDALTVPPEPSLSICSLGMQLDHYLRQIRAAMDFLGTPPPLAVVEGRRTWFDDNGSREAIEIDDLILWNQLPETFMLVIMPKPKEGT